VGVAVVAIAVAAEVGVVGGVGISNLLLALLISALLLCSFILKKQILALILL